MGVKKRILIFITLFGVVAGTLLIMFNQLVLNSSLVRIQEQQVQASVLLGQQKINSQILEMEKMAQGLVIFASELYQQKQQQPDFQVDRLVKQHLSKLLENNRKSIGAGIWFEPYALDANLERYGPYVYWDNDKVTFTWELNSSEYDYHSHAWYNIAFAEDRLNDKKAYWSPPYYDDAGTNELMVTVTIPILKEDGSKIGVATVDWAITQLTTALEDVEFTENASSFLINKSDQQFLSFPDSVQLHMQSTSKAEWGEQVTNTVQKETLSKLENISFNNLSGTIYFLEAKHGLVLGVFLPEKDYMQYIDRITSGNLLLSGLLMVFFLGGMTLLLNKMFAPLSQILDDIRDSIFIDENRNSIYVRELNDVGVKEFSSIVKILNKVYQRINEHTTEIAGKNQDLTEKQKEINELNSYLEKKVQERTHELESKTHEVIKVLDELKETQQQMIEMEKNAALGQLVAGMAHEINTPVGVCVTATSILKENHSTLKVDLDGNNLTKPGLVGYLEKMDEISEILQFNLSRMKELIDSFKQVSADQSSELARHFNLSEYLDLIIASHRLNLEKENIEIEMDVPENLEMVSYPGAISQVMNNLLSNTMMHAFDAQGRKYIAVSARYKSEDEILLIIKDNGKGMDEETQGKIFEPFFTTRRGRGGVGLGMHITYNLITQKLKGKIMLESELGQGSEFLITLPVTCESENDLETDA